MGEQVEGLKYHANLGAKLGELFPLFRECSTVNADLAGIDGFQSVDRAAQGRFSGAGRADDYDNLAFFYGEADVL